jgi:hypothetical protein
MSIKIKNDEILNALYKIDFDSNETKEVLDFIEKRKIIDIMNISSLKEKEKDIKFFSEINKYYNEDNILNIFEKSLFNDMNSITNNYKNDYDKINEILLQEKIIQEEYNKIMDEMNNNEEIIKTVFNFYSQYLKDNKIFLIKNEILKNFLDKILLTKEERDSLTSKKDSEKINLNIIQKINQIKNNIDIIQQNSTNFSKTLLQSIKKHYTLVDEMLNEKIVVYLKTYFKQINEKISLKDFKELKTLIQFLYNKEQYINFVLKEYIIMRKKFCEGIIKDKYLILSSKNIDSVYTYLNEDFMFYFMKELILISFFFIQCDYTFIKIEDAFELFVYNGKGNLMGINYNENNIKLFNKLESILNNFGKNKEKIFEVEKYINNLNNILDIFDVLFLEYTQKKELEFHQVYKFTLLSYYFCEKLDMILNETELTNKNKVLNSTFLTNKNNFSSILRNYENEELKQLNKMKANLIKYLKDIQILITENEINQKINKLINNYKIIFELYEKYKPQKEENNNDIINPNQHELYLYLLDFFDNNDQIENETNLEILFKIINLLHLLNTNFKSEKNIRLFKSLKDKIVNIILNNVLTEVKYESILSEKKSHNETINVIEELVDKIQINLVNINYIQDFNVKEAIKEKIKEQIKDIYQKKLIESNNNLSITEEELKNYLDII